MNQATQEIMDTVQRSVEIRQSLIDAVTQGAGFCLWQKNRHREAGNLAQANYADQVEQVLRTALDTLNTFGLSIEVPNVDV